jgi:diacylglycerol kinase (ATP)
MKTLFILNPTSGRKAIRDAVQAVIERVYPGSANPFRVYRCDRKEDLSAVIDQAIRDGFEFIVAVGGDGTVHEVATRLTDSSAVLGILPAGSGNGLARHLGIPLDPEAALREIPGGRIEQIDTALVNETPFINVAGMGFDAVVAERFASSTVRGLETYIREGMKAYYSYAAEDYEIELDGKRTVLSAYLIAVANASQYGNAARIAPLASLQDGMLDLSLLHHGSLLAVPLLLQQLFSGRLHHSAHVTTLKGREIRIRRGAAGPAHIDGEPVTLPAELTFRIRPASLRVLVPASSTSL